MSTDQLREYIEERRRTVETVLEAKRLNKNLEARTLASELNNILTNKSDEVSAAILRIVKEKNAKGERQSIGLDSVYPGFGKFFDLADESGLMRMFCNWLKTQKLDDVFCVTCDDYSSPQLVWWRMPAIKSD